MNTPVRTPLPLCPRRARHECSLGAISLLVACGGARLGAQSAAVPPLPPATQAAPAADTADPAGARVEADTAHRGSPRADAVRADAAEGGSPAYRRFSPAEY